MKHDQVQVRALRGVCLGNGRGDLAKGQQAEVDGYTAALLVEMAAVELVHPEDAAPTIDAAVRAHLSNLAHQSLRDRQRV